MDNVPKIRTIPEAVRLLHELDDSTAVTLRAVRRMVNNGELGVVCVGNKRLINFNELLDLLGSPNRQAPAPAPEYGVIRRVN